MKFVVAVKTATTGNHRFCAMSAFISAASLEKMDGNTNCIIKIIISYSEFIVQCLQNFVTKYF